MIENTGKPHIVVVNHQAANIHSVGKALEWCGADVEVTDSSESLMAADGAVLPGVGAMDAAMRALEELDLIEPIREFARSGRPMLSVCLGMQLLFPESDEGERSGLGLVDGQVSRFDVDKPGLDGSRLKVPHMGWNSINFVKPEEDRHPVFRGIPEDSYFYFVHSFHCQPSNPADVAATTAYGGPVCAAIAKGELVATQFHPEKSADLGLKIYTNFVRHVANLKSGRIN
ncbi:MAG: imidazole glycerol phosphate synthase subunit HisH [Dehalococcoidia bacterium]